MVYTLSTRSMNRLDMVHPFLVRAITNTIVDSPFDFGISSGVRTLKEQQKLVDIGASQTLNSRHRPETYIEGGIEKRHGFAIDIFVVDDVGQAVWEPAYYAPVLNHFRTIAMNLPDADKFRVIMGCAWQIPNILHYEHSVEQANDEYIKLRVSEGRKPFLDWPHIELHRVTE